MTVCMEVAANRGGSIRTVCVSFMRNPILVAMLLGLIVNISDIALHEGIATFATFAGRAAPPASLFALGVTLANSRLFPLDAPASATTVIKIFVHPLLVWTMVGWAGDLDQIWTSTVHLMAAGPCGAMPFVLALQYRVKADSVGLAIIYSTLASLVTLSIIG